MWNSLRNGEKRNIQTKPNRQGRLARQLAQSQNQKPNLGGLKETSGWAKINTNKAKETGASIGSKPKSATASKECESRVKKRRGDVLQLGKLARAQT